MNEILHPISDGVGRNARVSSNDKPTKTKLAIVPMPGFCRSGIHSSMTTALIPITTNPIGIPVVADRPWWRTSQGGSPSSDRNITAALAPNSHSPNRSWTVRLSAIMTLTLTKIKGDTRNCECDLCRERSARNQRKALMHHASDGTPEQYVFRFRIWS